MALFNFEKFSALKNGFCAISFERISVLDSNFVHRYIIIKCRSFNLELDPQAYGPLSMLKNS